jgi:hypothetical protein
MRTELIKAPREEFLQALYANIKVPERKLLNHDHWGAVGLVQAPLIDLYWALDATAKASNVIAALVSGNCPQHVQMLAIFGKQADVQTALHKIQEHRQ